jgi:2-dehydro-3-deoxygalactonokinase
VHGRIPTSWEKLGDDQGVNADELIGVDWGTTHRRAYRLDGRGALIDERADDQGLLAARGRFEASLGELLASFDAAGAQSPVLLSGMVGSAQGWKEAPYLDLDTPLVELPRNLVPVDAPTLARRCVIVPGYRSLAGGTVDVMRGEETQLLGAVALGHRSGWFVLPGTHSKWVQLEEGRILQFATYLTGELFALLGQHGTLASVLAAPQVHDDTAFADGVRAAGAGALSHALFGVRARVVARQAPAEHAAACLSGLLIGAEWADVQQRSAGALPQQVIALGTPELARRHAQAAQLMGVTLLPLDAREAYLAALRLLRAAL